MAMSCFLHPLRIVEQVSRCAAAMLHACVSVRHTDPETISSRTCPVLSLVSSYTPVFVSLQYRQQGILHGALAKCEPRPRCAQGHDRGGSRPSPPSLPPSPFKGTLQGFERAILQTPLEGRLEGCLEGRRGRGRGESQTFRVYLADAE